MFPSHEISHEMSTKTIGSTKGDCKHPALSIEQNIIQIFSVNRNDKSDTPKKDFGDFCFE